MFTRLDAWPKTKKAVAGQKRKASQTSSEENAANAAQNTEDDADDAADDDEDVQIQVQHTPPMVHPLAKRSWWMLNDRMRVRNALVPMHALDEQDKEWMERTPQDVRVDAVYRAIAAFKVGFTQSVSKGAPRRAT